MTTLHVCILYHTLLMYMMWYMYMRGMNNNRRLRYCISYITILLLYFITATNEVHCFMPPLAALAGEGMVGKSFADPPAMLEAANASIKERTGL